MPKPEEKKTKKQKKREKAKVKQSVSQGMKEEYEDYLDQMDEDEDFDDYSEDGYDSDQEFESEAKSPDPLSVKLDEGKDSPPPVTNPKSTPVIIPEDDDDDSSDSETDTKRINNPNKRRSTTSSSSSDDEEEEDEDDSKKDAPKGGHITTSSSSSSSTSSSDDDSSVEIEVRNDRTDSDEDEDEPEPRTPKERAKYAIKHMTGSREHILDYVLLSGYRQFKDAGIFSGADDNDDRGGQNDGDNPPDPSTTTTTTTTTTTRANPPRNRTAGTAGNVGGPRDLLDGIGDDSDNDSDDDDSLRGDQPRDDQPLVRLTGPNGGLPQERFSPHKTSAGWGSFIAKEGVGVFNDLLGLTSIGSAHAGVKEALETDKDKKKELMKEQAPIKTATGYANLISGGIGTAMSGLGLYGSIKGTDSANKRKSYQSSIGVFKNLLGVAGGMTKMATAGMGLWGDMTKSSMKDSAWALGTLGAGIGFLSNATSWFAAHEDEKERRQIMSDIDSISLANHNDHDNSLETRSKNQLKGIRDKNSDRYKTAKAYHRALKAKKYALQEAKGFQDIKQNQMIKGRIGTFTSGLTLASNLAQAIPAVANSVIGGIVKAVTPMLSTFGGYVEKYTGKASDIRAYKKTKEHKREVIKGYMERKRASIREQAQLAFAERPDKDSLGAVSDEEADRIALGRLGVDIEVKNSPVEKDDLDTGFEYYIQKQAFNIMHTSDQERVSMMTALHLDPNKATQADVESVLKGD